MAEFVTKKLSKSETRTNWRDEDGCNKITTGENSTRITDIDNTAYLILILDRLISIDGNLEILTRKIPLRDNIVLQDNKGKSGLFKPISVIHHKGEVVGDTTCGHYEADVLDKVSNQWFRTSDDMHPRKLLKHNVTEQGYIFLYKKAKH